MSGFDYGGKRPDGQFERHPSLPPEARQTLVRPVRTRYRHVGIRPIGATRPLTTQEAERYTSFGYVCFEPYGPDREPVTGRFWTRKQLDSGCGQVTSMPIALAETYAAMPNYYGRTFCGRCGEYFPVGEAGEFLWIEADGRDGPRVGT